METAAVWRLLRPQLDPPPSNVREISASPRRQRAWKTSFPSTLAASFFVALVGLSGYSLHQKNELVALHQKNELLVSHQKNELLALQAPRPAHIVGFAGGERASASPETTLSAADAPWTFVFNPDADDQLYRDDKLYRLRLRDMPSKRERWAYELRPDQDSELAISVPELAPGRYRLELSDGSGFYEQYLLRVTAPGRGD
jgi:hypothetical protein